MQTHWWRDAAIYQIYVRSFADSNGDGEGDLNGIRENLPALAELGVDAIWLTPFYVSPLTDGGYDVADYRDVDSRFGTLGDFVAVLASAHELGLRVILDVAPTRSAAAHDGCREAVAAEPGGSVRSGFIFRDVEGLDGQEPPYHWQSIFV